VVDVPVVGVVVVVVVAGVVVVGVVVVGVVVVGVVVAVTGAFFTCLTAWPRLRPSTVIAVCSFAKSTPCAFEALSAAMNCPWLRNPADACSIVIPAGSNVWMRASCCGLAEIFVETAFGSATVVVVVVVAVVPVVVVVGVVVVGVVVVVAVVVGALARPGAAPDFPGAVLVGAVAAVVVGVAVVVVVVVVVGVGIEVAGLFA
jgi:hypothetical protein